MSLGFYEHTEKNTSLNSDFRSILNKSEKCRYGTLLVIEADVSSSIFGEFVVSKNSLDCFKRTTTLIRKSLREKLTTFQSTIHQSVF